jgi:hypothetical protein
MVSDVSYNYTVTVPIHGLHLQGLTVQHVGWGLVDGTTSDFQACSYLGTAAIHLVHAHDSGIDRCGVSHVGGIGLWVEGGSTAVDLSNLTVVDVGAGGVRVGRGKPLSDEPTNARTR